MESALLSCLKNAISDAEEDSEITIRLTSFLKEADLIIEYKPSEENKSEESNLEEAGKIIEKHRGFVLLRKAPNDKRMIVIRIPKKL